MHVDFFLILLDMLVGQFLYNTISHCELNLTERDERNILILDHPVSLHI